MASIIPRFGKHKSNRDEKTNGSDVLREDVRVCNLCLIRGHKHDAKAFCPSCFTFLCQTCSAKHKQNIPDHALITDDFPLCEEYVKLKKQISYAIGELTQTENEAEHNIYLAMLYRDNAVEEIHNERRKINKMLDDEKLRVNRELDELELNIKSRILEKYTKDFEKFNSIKKETQSLKEDIQKINQTYNTLQQTPNNFSEKVATCNEQYAVLKRKNFSEKVANCNEQYAKLKNKVKQVLSYNEVTKYKFEPKWEETIRKMDIPQLGVVLTLDPAKATGIVTCKGEMNVHSPVDREFCNIKGMCLLSNHFLVTADQQNNSLKLIDIEQSKLVSTIPMSAGPRDVTTVKGTQIAVTLPTMKVIDIMTLSSDGSVSDRSFIPVKGACRGIIYNHGHFIVSFDFPKNEIQIIDIDGVVTKNLDTRHDPESQSNLAGLGLSPDHKLIYVADESRETVTCLTASGKVKAIYKDPHFEKPRGVAVASNGLVYVTGKGKIHELSSDLSQGRIVMDHSHGIHSVQSLTCSEQDNMTILYIGMIGQNMIKKFQIE